MRKLRFLISLTVVLLTVNTCLAAIADDFGEVRKGMSKEEVTQMLGKPSYSNVTLDIETWSYNMNWGAEESPEYVKIDVVFDSEGKVVHYNRRPARVPSSDYNVRQRPQHEFSEPDFGRRERRNDCMSIAKFNIFYNKVKAKSFTNDRLDLIEVGCLDGRLSCSQCAQLLDIFSFKDDKIKALRLMSPCLVDLRNASYIYAKFDFASDKELAATIIQRGK